MPFLLKHLIVLLSIMVGSFGLILGVFLLWHIEASRPPGPSPGVKN